MENRIKEQQLCLFADRTSTSQMRSNQLRLYLSSFAYCLMQALRRLGLAGTEMAKAAMRNDTAEALEGGGADQDHGAKGLASPVSRASLRRTLRHGVSEPDGPSRAALLKNPGSVLPTIR